MGIKLAGLIAGGVLTNWLLGRAVQTGKKRKAFREAYEYARKVNKRVLNAGCGSMPPFGDVNLDITPRSVPNFVLGNIDDMPFEDKEFGACVVSHVLEHVDNPQKALEECHRVADRVWVIEPPLWDVGTWLTPTHKWLVVKRSPMRFVKYNPLSAWYFLFIVMLLGLK